MDNRGASPLRIILIVAAVLVAIVFAFFGQLYFAYFLGVVAIVLRGDHAFREVQDSHGLTSLSSTTCPDIQLLHLAHARSGDKGDTANVGVIALRPEFYPVLVEQLTTERVKAHFRGDRPRRRGAVRAAQPGGAQLPAAQRAGRRRHREPQDRRAGQGAFHRHAADGGGRARRGGAAGRARGAAS